MSLLKGIGLIRYFFFEWSMPPPITQIIGQDRQFGGKQLFIDLRPYSTKFLLRNVISWDDWGRLRTYAIKRAGNKCQFCDWECQYLLHLHIKWHYDQNSQVRKPMRFLSICGDCQFATHLDVDTMIRHGDEGIRIKEHIKRVRSWSEQEFNSHQLEADNLFKHRNQIPWKADLTFLKLNHIQLIKNIKNSFQPENQTSQINNATQNL